MPFLPKGGLVVPKLFTPKIVYPDTKGDGRSAFARKQSRAVSSFIHISSGLRRKKAIFIPPALGARRKWEIWPKCQYWDIYTLGTPKLI